MPKVIYYAEDGKKVEIVHPVIQDTLLDVSLKNSIVHHHVCQGKARCTTCRVRLLEGSHHLTARTEAEQKIAYARNWPADIRLACQARLLGEVTIRLLVVDSVDVELISSEEHCVNTGQERSLVVMFCDIVNFTGFAATFFPYDVVYLLNRFYQEICTPVLSCQGYIDKYMGDGLMALFGLEDASPTNNCLNAIRASMQILAQVEELNKRTLNDFSYEFKVRIGLHYGLVIVGEIGHPYKRQLTVLGDTVNVASRIETTNKELGTHLLASQEVFDYACTRVKVGKVATVQLRGQNRSHTLYEIVQFEEKTDSL
jgi:adenylate cyclase